MTLLDDDVPPDVHAMAAYFADGSEDDHAQAENIGKLVIFAKCDLYNIFDI